MKLNVEELKSRILPSADMGGGFILLPTMVEFKPFEDFNGPLAYYDEVVNGKYIETYIGAKAPGGPRLAIVDPQGDRTVGDTFVDDPNSRGGVYLVVPSDLVTLASQNAASQSMIDAARHLADDYYELGKYGVRQTSGPELTVEQADSLLAQLSHEPVAYTKAFIAAGGITDIATDSLTNDPYFSILAGQTVTAYQNTGGPTTTFDDIGGVCIGRYDIVVPNGASGSISTILHERTHTVDAELNGESSSPAFEAVHTAVKTGNSYLDTYVQEDFAESNAEYLMGTLKDPGRVSFFDNFYKSEGWK